MDRDIDYVAAAQRDEGLPVRELIARYRSGVSALRDAVSDMDAATLDARPIPGKMSTREVVAHITDADQYLADRLKRTIATDRPLLIGVESAIYPVPLHYDERDVALDLDLLDVTRRQMANDLERLAEDVWRRTAIHSETGLVDLRQLLLHAINHLEGHLDAIGDKRAALGI